MGSRVVGQRAERVGRRPRVAAGGRGAGRPSPRTRARRASVHGQGLGRRELEALRELTLEPSCRRLPTRCFLPEWVPLSCRTTKWPGARPLRQIPAPPCGSRQDPADTVLRAPAQRLAAGRNPAAPSGRPRSASAQLVSAAPARREAQNRSSGPTCGVRARTLRSESFQTELLSGQTALSVSFSLSLF